MMLLGGMMVALAVEKSMLHKRLALKALLISGSKPTR
jgi:di/tricarboxylate transporter